MTGLNFIIPIILLKLLQIILLPDQNWEESGTPQIL